MVALVNMVSPEWRINQPHILHCHVLAVGNINQPWSLRILVCTLGIPLPTNPKVTPIMIAIAIDGAWAGDGKSIEAVSINQCREILASLSLYASLLDIEILYALTSTQHGSTLQI